MGSTFFLRGRAHNFFIFFIIFPIRLRFYFVQIQPYFGTNKLNIKRIKAMIKQPEIVIIAQATEDHPRQSEATYVELRNGSIMLAWQKFRKSQYGSGDQSPADICAMVSSDGGRTWGDLRVLIKQDPKYTQVYSPSLLRLKNGQILCTYMATILLEEGKSIIRDGLAMVSNDEGRTFSSPVKIWTEKPYGCASNVTKQLKNGRIIVPIEAVAGGLWTAAEHVTVGCIYSDDGGAIWRESSNFVDVPLRGAMEPHIEELKDGRILMIMRTQLGAVFQSISEDGGSSWSKAQTTGLKSPESCPELIRIPQTGDLLVVWNNSPYDPLFDHCGKRTPLSVAISKDDGNTWQNIKDIEIDPVSMFTNPAAIVTTKNELLVTYFTSKYADINPPGRMGIDRIHLKGAIVDISWLYE
jgi:sialidase-1